MNPDSLVSRKCRRLAVGAALLALCVAGPTQGPHVASLSGEVEVGRGEPPAWQPARAGDALAPGDVVRTGRDGRAELQLGSATVRLYGNSLLRLPPDGMGGNGPRAVELDRGHSLFDVLRRDPGDPFEVRTREVVVSVKGTRFSVDAADFVQVAVYHGLVGVLARETGLVHETLVREGFAAVGGSDRPFELFLHEAPDPWKTWKPDALPQRLPERAMGDAPAKLAVAAVERAASRSFQADAVKAAMERRPEVAERVAELVEARAVALEKRHQEGPDEKQVRELARDGVLDLPEDARREKVEVPFTEAWLARMSGSNGTTVPFDVTFQDGSGSSGPDLVTLTLTPNGQSWSFQQSEIEALLEGQGALPSALQTELQQQGIVDPGPLLEMMLEILSD